MASRSCRRVFVRYADLLAGWKTVANRMAARLDLSWPIDTAAADPEVSAFLSSDLRHGAWDDRSVMADRSLPAPIRRGFEIFSRWSVDDDQEGDADELDLIKADWDETGTVSPAPPASEEKQTRWSDLAKELKRPLLSIAIPAYDRPRELETALLKFIAQAVLQYGDIIEIIVTDDATPNDALRGVRERTSIYPFVHFDRNAPNIGLEQNLIHCTKRCSGEYLWIFGDDDFLEATDALDVIMSYLKEGTHDFYILNKTRRSSSLDKVISPNWMKLDPEENIHFPGLREFCLAWSFISVIGFISVNIFRRAPFSAVDPQPYFGTMYPQLGAMVEAFHHRPTLLLGRPLVCHRTQTMEEKRAAFAHKETEADYMSGGINRRRAIYYSHPLVGMLDRLLDVGAFQPDDIGKIREITEFGGGLLIDLVILSLGLSKDCSNLFSDADWTRARRFFERIVLDSERRAEVDTMLEADM